MSLTLEAICDHEIQENGKEFVRFGAHIFSSLQFELQLSSNVSKHPRIDLSHGDPTPVLAVALLSQVKFLVGANA